MAASSSSNVAAAKPPPLSYAERARRAGAPSASQSLQKARQSGPNGRTRSGDESTSPASSSRNLTPNSSAALTLPGSPPPSSSQTSVDEQQSFPPMPKSPSKPPAMNVWTVRKEQLARVAGQQHGHASASAPAENPSHQPPTATARMPANGPTASLQQDSSMKEERDPFVVRVPPRGHGRANVSRTPPSLDDDESWPEMGKGGLSASPSVSGSVIDLDKKDGSSKKGEKTSWVRIPPAELQASYDAHVAQSTASSRAQSQHRRNNQVKSRSRRESQARSTRPQSQSQNRGQNQGPSYVAGHSNGSGTGKMLGEGPAVQSRTESSTHSRTTSVHSSPRHPARGRRLPEEQVHVVNPAVNVSAGPSTAARRLPNGVPGPGEQAPTSQPSEIQDVPAPQQIYQDNSSLALGIVPPLPISGPHSQSHSPYSHSPVYYPTPPPNSAVQGYGFGPIPSSGGYAVPPLAPSPGNSGVPMQQQSFLGYAPYGLPQHPPTGQSPYPYMFQPVPFTYYQLPEQQHEAQERQRQDSGQEGESNVVRLSPVLPPPSTRTRPPPPDKSEPLAGYRAIAQVPVSPLLNASAPQQSISEVVEGAGEMIFGSVGQPGGLKSPSPVPVVSSARDNERKKKGTSAAFAVGFQGPATIRIKRSSSGKDGVDDMADAIKVIDLTDKVSKWEFGTSGHPENEAIQNEGGDKEQQYDAFEQNQAAQQQTGPQILQPQPHHTLHYPPPNGSQPFISGGYSVGPPMHLYAAPMPIPSHSPQNNVPPLPTHVPSLAPVPLNPGFVSPLTLSSPGPAPQSGGQVPIHMMGGVPVGDEWEVRDFGYGFGQFGGNGYGSEHFREERYERENYRELRDNFREPREFGGPGGSGFVPGRMRRSSTTGGYGYGYFENGRGGFGGRRGRGGFGRGYSRGGFGRGGPGNFQRHQPSLSVATSSFQHQSGMQQQQQHQQISPDVPNPNSYFVSPTTTTSQYIPSPYGQFNPSFPPPPPQSQNQMPSQSPSQPVHQVQPPPVPMPVTTLSFPLDPTRLYLLGQLEYYFSVQNLASDLFLRKQMDSRGWIPISLISSFNRVRQLTQDPELVREVLGISSLLEIRGDHVRLSNQQWENFVLPSATTSTVENEESGSVRHAPVQEVEKEGEEGEEDDVVFILGGEESRPWTGTN